MKKNFQKIPLLITSALLIFLGAVFIFLHGKTYDNENKAEEGAQAWQTEVARRNDIRMLDRTLQRLLPKRALLDTHFAQSADIVPFLDTIEKLAPQAGAHAEVTSVDAAPDKASLIVGLKASGTFPAIYKFLELLENSPYELDFLSMDIRKSTQESGDTWEAVFKLQLLTFIQ